MKLRTMIVVASALLVVGGTSVFANENLESLHPDVSSYRLEESYPVRETNRGPMHDLFDRGPSHFDEAHFREMERFHSEWDDFTEEEREEWTDRRNSRRQDSDDNRFVGHHGMMGPRGAFRPRHGCGYHR